MISYPFPSVWHTLNDNYQALDFQTIEYLSKILRVFVYGYLNIWIANLNYFIWIIINAILTDLSSWLYNVWPCSRKMSCVNIVSRLIKSSVNLTDLPACWPVPGQAQVSWPPSANPGPVIFLSDARLPPRLLEDVLLLSVIILTQRSGVDRTHRTWEWIFYSNDGHVHRFLVRDFLEEELFFAANLVNMLPALHTLPGKFAYWTINCWLSSANYRVKLSREKLLLNLN